MNWDAVGAIAAIVGAFAVVVTLIYVAIQIRQHTRATKLSTAQNVSRDLRDALAVIANDIAMAEIHLKALNAVDTLSPAERHRFYIYMNNLYKSYENAYYQNLSGALEAHVWEGVIGNLVLAKDSSGYASFWRDRKQIFSKAFRDFCENELGAGACDLLDAYQGAESESVDRSDRN